MVDKIMKLALVSLLLVVHQNLLANMAFDVQLSADTTALGKPVWIYFKVPLDAPPINTINLDPLGKDFHVDCPIESERIIESNQQAWKCRLYPYLTGIKDIPALFFNNSRSPVMKLAVRPAQDPKTGAIITVDTIKSRLNPWSRQQVLFSYRVTTEIHRAQFRIAHLNNKDLLSEKLEPRESHPANDPGKSRQYHLGWAMYPVSNGEITIELPPLELVRDGVLSHRFFYPPLTLDVKPLPTYLPATIPVGTLQLVGESPFRLFFQDNLEEIQLSVIGKNLPATSLPELGNRMLSNNKIRVYPEQGSRQQFNNFDGIVSRIDYIVPVKARGQGLMKLAKFKINYFDPETGTLQTQQFPGITVFVINKWLAGVFVILLFLLASYAMFWIAGRLYNYMKKIITYRNAISSLDRVGDIADLRKIFQLVSSVEVRNNNMSLSTWFHSIIKQPHDRDQALLIHANELFYFKTADPQIFSEVVKGLHELLRRNAPFPLLFN